MHAHLRRMLGRAIERALDAHACLDTRALSDACVWLELARASVLILMHTFELILGTCLRQLEDLIEDPLLILNEVHLLSMKSFLK